MQYIEIEQRGVEPLEPALSDVKRPGDFFVYGAIEMLMPRVEIEGASRTTGSPP